MNAHLRHGCYEGACNRPCTSDDDCPASQACGTGGVCERESGENGSPDIEDEWPMLTMRAQAALGRLPIRLELGCPVARSGVTSLRVVPVAGTAPRGKAPIAPYGSVNAVSALLCLLHEPAFAPAIVEGFGSAHGSAKAPKYLTECVTAASFIGVRLRSGNLGKD